MLSREVVQLRVHVVVVVDSGLISDSKVNFAKKDTFSSATRDREEGDKDLLQVFKVLTCIAEVDEWHSNLSKSIILLHVIKRHHNL